MANISNVAAQPSVDNYQTIGSGPNAFLDDPYEGELLTGLLRVLWWQ